MARWCAAAITCAHCKAQWKSSKIVPRTRRLVASVTMNCSPPRYCEQIIRSPGLGWGKSKGRIGFLSGSGCTPATVDIYRPVGGGLHVLRALDRPLQKCRWRLSSRARGITHGPGEAARRKGLAALQGLNETSARQAPSRAEEAPVAPHHCSGDASVDFTVVRIKARPARTEDGGSVE